MFKDETIINHHFYEDYSLQKNNGGTLTPPPQKKSFRTSEHFLTTLTLSSVQTI